MTAYTWLDNLPNLIETIPPQSIISRTIHKNAHVKAVLFGFDSGQALSEHSAGQPAIIHMLQGEASVTIGDDHFDASAGAWAYLPARLTHSIEAKTPLIMLLLLLNPGESAT